MVRTVVFLSLVLPALALGADGGTQRDGGTKPDAGAPDAGTGTAVLIPPAGLSVLGKVTYASSAAPADRVVVTLHKKKDDTGCLAGMGDELGRSASKGDGAFVLSFAASKLSQLPPNKAICLRALKGSSIRFLTIARDALEAPLDVGTVELPRPPPFYASSQATCVGPHCVGLGEQKVFDSAELIAYAEYLAELKKVSGSDFKDERKELLKAFHFENTALVKPLSATDKAAFRKLCAGDCSAQERSLLDAALLTPVKGNDGLMPGPGPSPIHH